MSTTTMNITTVAATGNFSAHINWFYDYTHLSLFFFSFDTVEKLWEVRAPLPFSADSYSAVEKDGSIYVSGSEYNLIKFWCYAPEQNLWTENAGIRTGEEKDVENIALFKMKGRVCLSNRHIGFHTYGPDIDRWIKVIFFIQKSRNHVPTNKSLRVISGANACSKLVHRFGCCWCH